MIERNVLKQIQEDFDEAVVSADLLAMQDIIEALEKMREDRLAQKFRKEMERVKQGVEEDEEHA